MLVLSRLPGEAIRVGSNVIITLLEVQGRRVRIGVDAPAQIRVLRDELCACARDSVAAQGKNGEETGSCS
jgi:carbon storage regulator